MATNPYDLAARDLFSGQAALGARSAVSEVHDRNPDTEVQVQQKAAQLGVPYDSARANPAIINRRAAAQAVDYDNLAKQAPATTRFLSSTSHAAIAHDDIGVLGSLEKGIAALGAVLAPATASSVLGNFLTQRVSGPGYYKGTTTALTPTNVGHAFMAGVAQAGEGLAGTMQAGAEINNKIDVTSSLQRRLFGASVEDKIAQLSQSARRSAVAYENRVTPQTQSPFGQDVLSGVESIPTSIAAAATTYLTDNPAPALGLMGAITGGQGYGQARDQGFSVGRSAVKGGIDAAVEMATEYLPEKYMLADIHGHSGFAKFLADQIKTEVPGEQAATLLQDFNQWALLDANKGKSFHDYADEIVPHALSTLVATGVGVAAMSSPGIVFSAANKLMAKRQQAMSAQALGEHIEDFNKLAVASKLRERAPGTFSDLVNQMADGSPVEDVYVPAEKLAEAVYNQTGIEDPEKAAAQKQAQDVLGPRIAEAMHQGTDVRVPVGEYATYLADNKALLDHIKVDPNGMTKAEAEEFMAGRGEELKAEIERSLEAHQGDEAHQSEVQQVKQSVLDQLAKANRFTAPVNERYADLHAAFYGTMAKRLGVSPNTLYERFPIRIVNRAMPDSHLNQHDTPEFKQWFGDSKVVDEKGAPLTVYHGSPDARFLKEDGAFKSPQQKFGVGEESGVHWFTKDHAVAKTYAKDERAFDYQNAEPAVVAAHLKLENPLLIDAQGKAWREAQQRGKTRDVIDEARENGHDGVIIKNVRDDYSSYEGNRTGKATDTYAVFDSTQIKSVDNQGAYDPNDPNIYRQDNPIFYSELERAVEASKQAKASGDQWLATLSKTPGVKKEEIEWTELPEWLATQDGPVTREELLAFVRAGGVQVEEVDKGAEPSDEALATEADSIIDVWWRSSDIDPDTMEADEASDAYNDFYERNIDSAYEAARANLAQTNQTFKDYTEEGGEDYHELLLTLPPGVRGNPERAPSTHFDEPGVVAHLRFKTRSTTDGKKLLFIEEVQSDWHQKGRDSGYAVPSSPEEINAATEAQQAAQVAQSAAEAKRREVIAEIHDAAAEAGIPTQMIVPSNWKAMPGYHPTSLIGYMGEKDTALYDRFKERLEQAGRDAAQATLRLNEATQAYRNALGQQGIPDAPFKATWPALVMKRAIRWAADNGFEAVAWTTGEQQRERYNLSRSVGEIRATAAGDGKYVVNAGYGISQDLLDRNLATPNEMSVPVMTPEQIGEVFGKDLGSRMMALADQASGEEVRLQGDDLKIGGEGMLAFYDRNLVNITNGILKKLGGAKVEPIPVRDFASPTSRTGHTADDYRAELQKIDDVLAQSDDLLPSWERERWATQRAATEQRIKDLEPTPNPGFHITPEIAQHAREGFALFQKNRGAYSPATDTISLLEHADLSTFLHESGHFYLEALMRMADEGNAPQQIKDDAQAVLDWFKVKDLAAWNAMSLEDKRASHEKFARGFEAYLFTGKAPASRLREMFRTFRSWLVAVYKHATNLGVRPTPQIRDVMDRMLASDDEIAQAQAARSMEPLFKDQAASGMSEDQWRDYQRTNATATEEASGDLTRRSLRDLKWFDNARGREINRLKRQADAVRKATKARVAAEVAAEPVYRAQQYLKRGVLDGEQHEGPHKLSIESVDTALDGNPDGAEIKRKLGYGAYGILAETGLDAEATAQVFGFTSADHLIQSLTTAEPIKDRIAGLTEQRLLEEHGDLTDPQSIEEAASEAVHNEFRARAVAAELSALAKAAGKPRLLAQAARQFAEDTVARTRVRDLKPGKYEAAASRAAKAAMKALGEGNLAQAALEKRNQLFNIYATKGVQKAQAEVAKALALFDRVTRPATAKSIDAAYRDQIVQLLDRYDLNRGTTLKAIDKRVSLAAWVERQKDLGFNPVVPDDLLNDAAKRSYKTLTVEELRGIADTVRNIEHIGRLKSKLLTAKKDRDFAEAVDRMTSVIVGNAAGYHPVKIERNALRDKAKAGVFHFLALHRKFASLARQMDGQKDGGAIWEYLVRPMNAAADKETTMRAEATQKLIDVMKPLQAENLTRKTMIPAIGTSLSLEGRLAIALNMGNEINRSRLRDGDNWSDEQIDAIGATLTAEQWGVVQTIWDTINAYWPEVAAKERRVTGVEPEKVEGDPFQIVTADGQTLQLPGGYYPIKYDAERSSRAEADEAAEVGRAMMQGAYTRATTRRGHTKARVDTVKRPVRKDIGVIGQHLTEVIHDLSWHEYLIDANRLLGASAIDAAVRDHYGPEVLRALKDTIKDAAAGDIPARNAFERAVNWLRTGATVAGMGWSMTTALLQPLGLAQSMVRIGPKYVARGMGRWLGDAARMQNTVKWITEQSPMMAHRASTLQREINEIRNSVTRTKASSANEHIKASFFYLIAKLQLIADIPTWIGQYQKSIDAGEEHERAVALADQAVLDSQGGGQIKDQAGIQRGGPLLKVWTNFYSYFSVTYNLAAEAVGETRRVGSSHLPILAADFLLLFVVPNALQVLMLSALRGDDKDWPEIAKEMGVSSLMAFPQSMIGVRDIAAALSGDQRSQAPAGIVGRQFYQLGTQVQQGDADAAFWKALNQIGGIIFHYPAAQVQRTALGVAALANGDTANPAAALLGAPQQPQAHHKGHKRL